MRTMWSAWILMSVAWPEIPCPPISGWWIRISEFGRAKRLPLVPLASRKGPIEAAMPTQMVETSHLM